MVQSTCCLWRNLVLDMPRLWSCIEFGSLENFSGLPLEIEMANLWIERSRSVPLDLVIALRNNSDCSNLEIARLFAPHWTRCRSLFLSYRIWRRGTRGPPFPFSNSMPLLQRLDLSIEGPYELGEGHIERVVIPLADYPRLCSLNLQGTYPRGLSISFGESIASSITCISLRINQFDLSTLSRLIAVCPALRSLSWRSPRNNSIAAGPMINLPPSMVELKMCGEPAIQDIAKFRGQNVQSLRIDYLRSALGSQLPHNPFPNLRKLDLESFESFSSLCPILQIPCVEEIICGDRFLERLTSGELDMFIEACRNLRTLKIKGWFYPPLAEDGMCAEEFARRLLDRQPSPKISLFSWASHASWSPGIVLLSQQFPERFSIFPVPEPA
jgi:hypothetical protein